MLGICEIPGGMIGLPVGGAESGFPFNLNLAYGVAPPNFPPRTRDRLGGSSPLVSREVEHFLGPVAPAHRPVLNGTVDLITGAPLLQDVDLELPFGGALFRHVRTYSEPSTVGWHEMSCLQQALAHDGPGYRYHGSQLYWDWQGQGWMMGENPILLVDARYWGTSEFTSPQPPAVGEALDTWCYLIPDSHHSIPFKFDKVNGEYVAPARFGVVMSHNGDWDPQELEWVMTPTEFYVWLDQVNEAEIDDPGGPTDPLVIGFLVKHYMYDGLGRLVRVQSPYPDPVIGASTEQVRSERYHYDGVRRIQEVLLDPVIATENAAMAGDPGALASLAANPDLDGSVATLGTEESQSSSGGSGGGPPEGSVLSREYVCGPGDRGVDELLVRYDLQRNPTWALSGNDDFGNLPAGTAARGTRP